MSSLLMPMLMAYDQILGSQRLDLRSQNRMMRHPGVTQRIHRGTMGFFSIKKTKQTVMLIICHVSYY